MRTSCCASPTMMGPGGGSIEAFCRDCDEETCSECAALFEQEGGYGDDGTHVRTFALCQDCYSAREYRRQIRDEQNDSGV